jgi:hypothetical protein
MDALSAAAMAAINARLPWFRAMSAENRSWLGLVAQAALATFVDWVKHPERDRPAVAGQVFGTAPRELARAVSMQQAFEMACRGTRDPPGRPGAAPRLSAGAWPATG